MKFPRTSLNSAVVTLGLCCLIVLGIFVVDYFTKGVIQYAFIPFMLFCAVWIGAWIYLGLGGPIVVKNLDGTTRVLDIDQPSKITTREQMTPIQRYLSDDPAEDQKPD